MGKTKYKILVSYHKPDIIFKNDIIEPIHVGRSVLSKKNDPESIKKNAILCDSMIGDNEGENISNKNGTYNEMTAVYWAWKNYEKIGNPDYIGFMHYRRHFCLKKMGQSAAYLECNNIPNVDNYINETLGITEQELDRIFSTHDILVSSPYYTESVYEHYKEAHNIKELDYAVEVVKKKYPKYYRSCKKYLHGHNTYFCNMFVFPKRVFFEYCSFIFGVLGECEKSPLFEGTRLYVSERLTGSFIQYLIDHKMNVAYAPTMYFEEKTLIPVAFATDRNFVPPTLVAIESMLSNAHETTFYDIFVLSPTQDRLSIEESFKYLDSKFENFKVQVIGMDDVFADAKMSISHTTLSTYYRLKLPELLKEYDKCLYLDGDIIVNSDLSELFRNNIADFYVAGVRAPGYYYPKDWVDRHKKELGLPSIDKYINAGVLLLNLKKIRDDGVQKQMINLVKKSFSSQDQDIINVACYNGIKVLPVKYNLMTKYVRFENGTNIIDEKAIRIWGELDSKEALKSPMIIHYADKEKPWNNSGCVLFDQWNKYAQQVPYYKKRRKRKISVIIPIYNMEKYLGQCLDSVFNQTLKDIDVICINDGSVDRSLDILTEYKKNHDNLFIINQTNHGVAFSRNVGIDYAQSEYLCFMDPDDFYPSNNVLKKLYQAVKTNKVLIAGGSWMEMIEKEDGTSYYKTDFSNSINSGYTFNKNGIMKYRDYQFDFGYHRFIYNVDLLKSNNIKFPLYTRYQDPPFFVKAMIAAKEFYALKDVTYCYRLGYQTKTIFVGKKLIDYTLGIIDVLRISQRNGLAKLHSISVDRLCRNNDLFLERIAAGEDIYLFELLIRANSAIDRKLLRRVNPKINENYIVEPLRNVMRYFDKIVVEKRVRASWKLSNNPGKGSVFCRAIRYLKKHGIKCFFIRIFKGKEIADVYIRKRAIAK